MDKYTLSEILEAWDAAYGEDMAQEYPGFIQRLSEEAGEDVKKRS
jgi:hemoglobin-like flavoprotein